MLAGTSTPLGVLPLGTFNQFAKDLGLDGDLQAVARQLTGGHLGRVDVAVVNGRVFVNNSSLGVYPAMVSLREAISERRGWGKLRAVPLAVVGVPRRFPLHRLTITTADGTTRSHVRTPFVFVGNGRFDNADGGLGERSSLVGGTLCVYLASVVSRWGLVRLAFTALLRRADRVTDLERLDVTELTIASRARHLDVAVDGEVTRLTMPLHYRVRPQALRVLAPSGSTSVAPDDVVTGRPDQPGADPVAGRPTPSVAPAEA